MGLRLVQLEGHLLNKWLSLTSNDKWTIATQLSLTSNVQAIISTQLSPTSIVEAF